MRKTQKRQNYKFSDSAVVNDATYLDYLERFKKVALSIFEWVNLPKSMNARWLERCLFYKGMAALLYDEKYGFINTNCSSGGYVNLYGLPTKLNCYSFDFQSQRNLYTGFNELDSEEEIENKRSNECIVVMNNWECVPTFSTMELFAYRLYEAQRTCDVNIKAQKTPILLLVDEKQRLMMENMYNQYDGNQPFMFGDNSQLSTDIMKSINTGAPFIADKVTEYKKEIWNEALQFLGINTLSIEKKERLITDEASSNNELINLNLQSFLAPRQEAAKKFNELFGLTGTDKEISVRVRSDLFNVIKTELSSVKDFDTDNDGMVEKEEIESEVENG